MAEKNPIEPLALQPDAAAKAASVSRDAIFAAIRNGELTARKSGRRTLIEVEELRRWVQSLPVRQPVRPAAA